MRQYDGPALRVQSTKPACTGSVNRCGQVVCSRALQSRPELSCIADARRRRSIACPVAIDPT
jgi:hypothetical protein